MFSKHCLVLSFETTKFAQVKIHCVCMQAYAGQAKESNTATGESD